MGGQSVTEPSPKNRGNGQIEQQRGKKKGVCNCKLLEDDDLTYRRRNSLFNAPLSELTTKTDERNPNQQKLCPRPGLTPQLASWPPSLSIFGAFPGFCAGSCSFSFLIVPTHPLAPNPTCMVLSSYLPCSLNSCSFLTRSTNTQPGWLGLVPLVSSLRGGGGGAAYNLLQASPSPQA